jgi:hypothetical protein
MKYFQLRPDRWYRATVRAIGRDIETQFPGGTGANLCLFGTWTHSTDQSRGIGTFDGEFTLSFKARGDGRVCIALRLGYWCCEAKGRVVFSNFRIELDSRIVTFGTGRVHISLIREEIEGRIDFSLINLFFERMSCAYFAMAQLYGQVPFNGDDIDYECHRGIDAWAFSGNPICWNTECAFQYFDSLANGDDACFGTIHEMGHNFEQTRLSDINHEMIANLGLCYAVENIGFPILFSGEYTVGRGLQDNFYRRCYEGSIGKADKSYSHDGLLYCILRVKDHIGWEPFERVMRILIANPPDPAKPAEIFAMWMNMLADISKKDVRAMFPEGEYEFILKQEEF